MSHPPFSTNFAIDRQVVVIAAVVSRLITQVLPLQNFPDKVEVTLKLLDLLVDIMKQHHELFSVDQEANETRKRYSMRVFFSVDSD